MLLLLLLYSSHAARAFAFRTRRKNNPPSPGTHLTYRTLTHTRQRAYYTERVLYCTDVTHTAVYMYTNMYIAIIVYDGFHSDRSDHCVDPAYVHVLGENRTRARTPD